MLETFRGRYFVSYVLCADSCVGIMRFDFPLNETVGVYIHVCSVSMLLWHFYRNTHRNCMVQIDRDIAFQTFTPTLNPANQIKTIDTNVDTFYFCISDIIRTKLIADGYIEMDFDL